MVSNSKSGAIDGNSSDADRIESEREFHNKRFAEEVRQPTHGFYRTVAAAFDYYESEKVRLAKDANVLEYGCGTGGNAIKLAKACKAIHGLDLSDVAIEQATRAAADLGLTNTTFSAGNAEEMAFADSSFDFVFGSSILHHLDLNRAYSELNRVLKSGGCALFLEPLGHNPVINAYRNRTPEYRTPDEHPLLRQDFKLAEKYFDSVDAQFYGLATLSSIPFMKIKCAAPFLVAGHYVDKLLLRVPGIKWMAWFSVIKLKKNS